jgi:hypothetical protein
MAEVADSGDHDAPWVGQADLQPDAQARWAMR